jgi:accessory gene regulator protein AgrB
MINQICESLTNKIRQEMPDIDDEEAEVIKYGLELIIGEVPKILLLFIIAIVLKIGWLWN